MPSSARTKRLAIPGVECGHDESGSQHVRVHESVSVVVSRGCPVCRRGHLDPSACRSWISNSSTLEILFSTFPIVAISQALPADRPVRRVLFFSQPRLAQIYTLSLHDALPI